MTHITQRVFAVYTHPQNGRPKDKLKTRLFELNDRYEVEDVKHDKKTTYVMLDDTWYNSVQFDFFDKDGNQVDYFFDINNNPYTQFRFKESATYGI